METSILIEYWALHSHILTYFQKGGSFNEAVTKWKSHISAVKYFHKYYQTHKF
jgi:hypothetical protein